MQLTRQELEKFKDLSKEEREAIAKLWPAELLCVSNFVELFTNAVLRGRTKEYGDFQDVVLHVFMNMYKPARKLKCDPYYLLGEQIMHCVNKEAMAKLQVEEYQERKPVKNIEKKQDEEEDK